MQDRAVKIAAVMFIVGGAFWGLFTAKSILIPLAVAIVVGYLLEAMADALRSALPRGERVPRWVFLLASLLLAAVVTLELINAMTISLSSVTEAAPVYQENIYAIIKSGAGWLGMKEAPSLDKILAGLNVEGMVGSMAGLVAEIAGDLGLIVVYVIFMIVERPAFEAKLRLLVPEGQGRERSAGVMASINDRIRKYVLIKTFASILVGVLSYAVLFFVGVDFPFFWSFLIFLFNYIPTVGALAGVGLPSLLALVQFASPGPFLAVVIGLVVIQFLTGNLLEPKLLGASLNISPLVVLLSLAVWGKLWGITGMFLCVPLTVILMIIFAEFPKTRPVAVMLSADGNVGGRG
jgi:predicted PurR-regulated permease PerM